MKSALILQFFRSIRVIRLKVLPKLKATIKTPNQTKSWKSQLLLRRL